MRASANCKLRACSFRPMTRTMSLVAPMLLATALALSPEPAHAQLDLGGVVGGVGSAVGGAVGSVGNTVEDTVDGLGNTVDGVVDGTVDAVTPGSSPAPGSPAPAIVTLDQNAALALVQSQKALPLEEIMKLARLQIEGEIIDAHLIQVRGFLLYELKVVDTDGDVSDIYFYARSGERVQTN
jgi:uncharacterized membrane protein YkoI